MKVMCEAQLLRVRDRVISRGGLKAICHMPRMNDQHARTT